MKLITKEGEYKYSKFYGKNNVIFKLTSIECKENCKVLSCMDSFITPNGTIVELKRKDIVEQVELGKMLPVIGSEIEIPKYDKKKFDIALGRR